MSDGIGPVENAVEEALHIEPGSLKHPAEPMQQVFDALTAFSAAPGIILSSFVVTLIYVVINHYWLRFDQTLQLYTFAVSYLAIFLAQVILNSQMREAEKDKQMAINSYRQVEEIDALQKAQMEMLTAIHDLQKQIAECHAR